ncbi:MAG: FixH family protein [Dehalococcoidia bacterium]
MSKLARLILPLVVALAGCTSATPSAPAGAGAEPLVQTVDGVKFQAILNPAPPQSSQTTTVEITVADPQGQPVSDGRMVVTLESRGHSMSSNVATAEPKGNGVWSATLKPAGMTGEHTLTADLQWQGKSYRASFGGVNVR